MKNHLELTEDLNTLRNNIRARITSYACKFDTILIDKENSDVFKISFENYHTGLEKQKTIDGIIAEGSNVVVCANNINYEDRSENTIEDVHDLFMVLSIIEDHLGIPNPQK